MDIIKDRKASQWFTGLTYLNERLKLSQETRLELLNQQKGWEGERKFDDLIKEYLMCEALVLNDLLLSYSGKSCQIDTLVITSDKVILYEIKNYQGNFTMLNGQLQTASGKPLGNPTVQLSRTGALIERMLDDWGIDRTFESFVMFIHPHFHLYLSSETDPFIFPAQIIAHLTCMSKQTKALDKMAHYLADKLLSVQRQEVPYQKVLPAYTFEECSKGLSCLKCSSLKLTVTQRKVYCRQCRHKASMQETLYFNIEQFRFLFPNKPITTRSVAEWTGLHPKNKRLNRLLNTHYTRKGVAKSIHYEPNHPHQYAGKEA
ncbi:hypothetical protein ADIAL_0422 [Alkalibacterium sp. AK22]|uniref:nuclease-related domain-containing protein n=1 Tax=Alkalibacterium sp. AK22 TaxID=1229520 RepID=UPI0004520BBA|nr:nuclease-related domain-containing protein [Alkalibacterium sp. AK22]EXJ24111.1 hypothetical protein ADIAL_0422 [Alkalibacterium sp. AK22]